MRMMKKGQAAMEFLMTYGWAILVVLAAIAALAYFGVLSPDRFLPEKCTMPSGIACLDFTIQGSNITVSLQNSAGFDMSGANLTLTDITPSSVTACNKFELGTVANGEKRLPSVACTGLSGLSSGTKLKATLNLEYLNSQTNLKHNKTGEIIAKTP